MGSPRDYQKNNPMPNFPRVEPHSKWAKIENYKMEDPIDPDLLRTIGPVFRAHADEDSHTVRLDRYPYPRENACPSCFRPHNGFKWHWYYEATNQKWKAFFYRILNR